ncbi:MAG: DNA polymerase I [Flavobacteriaceae bacterium]|nr:MAG: DNA polymerase I [Flavobacteriaceae bacterium]
MSSTKKLFLLDAYALIFRGYYAFIKNPRINSKGVDTSAILGFTNSLLDVIKRERPSHLAVVFDVGKATVRTDYFDQYKANRDATPEAIKIAVPYILTLLEALEIPALSCPGYEADDVIGTLAKKAEKENFEVFMMTPDKDFAQLVSQNIKMYKPAKSGQGAEVWGVEEVKERYGLKDPIQMIDLLGMMGDSADNIPGLPGVGEKTAQKFIEEFGSMENLLENTHLVKGKMREKIEQNKELGLLSKKLATILLDAPIELNEQELAFVKPSLEKAQILFEELEFRKLFENLQKTYTGEQTESPEVEKIIPKAVLDGYYQTNLFDAPLEIPTENSTVKESNKDSFSSGLHQIIDNSTALKLLLKSLSNQKEICFWPLFNENENFNSTLLGLGVCYKENLGYYLDISSIEAEKEGLFSELLCDFFAQNNQTLLVSHDVKSLLKGLDSFDIKTQNPWFDTKISHYLINPDMRHDVESLSVIYLNKPLRSLESLLGKNKPISKDLSLELQNEIKLFASQKTSLIWGLKQHFNTELEKEALQSLFEEIEMPLVSVLHHMESQGIAINTPFLEDLSTEMAQKIEILEDQIQTLAGENFNLNSPKQLGVILFEKLKLVEKPKKTKTGQYATSEEILQDLSQEHEIVKSILEYRQLQKLKSTYVDALPKQINPKTGRIHTDYSQTTAATGRLASNNPNLQNIPIRSLEGQKVREAFVPRDENFELFSADYSQIELRLIAQMSGDPSMVEAFVKGQDIHLSTAAKVFDIPLEKVTKQQRSQAKTVNFGIIYGVSAFGLSQQTGLSRGEAKELIEAYFKNYPGLSHYMEDQKEFARENSYVQTLLGRRRYLKDIHSANSMVRSHAERNAINAPVQGTAADIIKIAMIKIDKLLENYQSKMLLQVHDELVFDLHKDEKEVLIPQIISLMQNAYPTEVPLLVEAKTGKNWLAAH